MGVLLDTDVLIGFEKGHLNLSGHISGREQDDFFISVITASELLHGVWRAVDPVVRAKRTAFVEGILKHMPVLLIDLPVARVHAQLWADLTSKGTMIGLHDSWIAAICIANGLTLVTSNLREFERVQGLEIECWTNT
jgi:tRNA(fMet)-specific endonuclease VapC